MSAMSIKDILGREHVQSITDYLAQVVEVKVAIKSFLKERNGKRIMDSELDKLAQECVQLVLITRGMDDEEVVGEEK